MLENRSFDHMCGYFNRFNKNINGLTGNESNPLNVSDPKSPRVFVNDNAAYVDPDPDHSVPGTTEQIYGTSDPFEAHKLKPTMQGFVQSALHHHLPKDDVMSMFNPESVPIMSSLAKEFAIFDQWHASVPGPTEVNRMYIHSATSHGATTNVPKDMIDGYPQRPFYLNVADAGLSWKVYMSEISTALMFKQLRSSENLKKIQFFENFLDDAKNGNLPNYAFIDPQYYAFLDVPANDQHPSHSVAEGEALIKQVYEALRSSPQWNSTVLIVTYDEHGGFFDHVPPPINIPNPDGLIGKAPQPLFNFTRLGVRIPTVMASPCIPKGTVFHKSQGPTPSSHFDHTSTLSTLKKMWKLPNFLTKRDAWSSTFEDVFNLNEAPRNDCPETLPPAPRLPKEQVNVEGNQPMNDFQMSLFKLAHALHGYEFDELKSPVPDTQYEAGMIIRELVQDFMQKTINQ